MTQNEIIEGNKAIAEFMGYKFNVRAGKTKHILMSVINPEETEWTFATWIKEDLDEYIKNRLPYHASFDSIMPVVEKIENMDGLIHFIIRKQYVKCECYNPFSTFTISAQGIPPNDKITAIWLAVVSFIKWYNTTKTNNNVKD